MPSCLHIIGGGLAGAEAAWQAGNLGIDVVLYEMRPNRSTEVHKTQKLAELVCSNSFRSDDHNSNAVGVLHQEMRMMKSLIMRVADLHKVPAGGALAVDRELFSNEVERQIKSHPNITINREEILSLNALDWSHIIVATGPLTAKPLAEAIKKISVQKGHNLSDTFKKNSHLPCGFICIHDWANINRQSFDFHNSFHEFTSKEYLVKSINVTSGSICIFPLSNNLNSFKGVNLKPLEEYDEDELKLIQKELDLLKK